MNRLAVWADFAWRNVPAPIVFFAVFQRFGTKPAIASAVAITLPQILVRAWRGGELSPLFMVSSGFTLLFGGMDLVLNEPRFFRLSPFAQNLAIGLGVFALTVAQVPVAEWFAASIPEHVRPRLDGTMRDYLQRVTYLWCAYFLLKAALYLYLSYRVDLGELILWRSIIGSTSFAILAAGEIAYRRRYLSRPRPAPRQTPTQV